MKVYRLRHKPTGLFYGTKCGYSSKATNLRVTKGKLYWDKPRLPTRIYVNDSQQNKFHYFGPINPGRFLYTTPEAWEIIEYELTEV